VDSARRLYERFRQLIHEGAKFGVVGIIGVIITDGGTNLIKAHSSIGWVTANVLATVVATAFAYVMSRYWTFKHRERTSVRREGVMFFVLNGLGLLIQLACLDLPFTSSASTASSPPTWRYSSASCWRPCSGSGLTGNTYGPTRHQSRPLDTKRSPRSWRRLLVAPRSTTASPVSPIEPWRCR